MKIYRVEIKEFDALFSGLAETTSLPSTCLKETWYNQAGQIHREDDLPAIILKDEAGNLVGEMWFKNGQKHRDHGAATIFTPVSEPKEMRWFQRDVHHRHDGPSYQLFSYDQPDLLLAEAWERDGKWHRTDGPASRMISQNGVVIHEHWFVDGLSHRIGGPANLERSEKTGVLTEEHWCVNGKSHRIDGPAWIVRDADSGFITQQEFYLHDVKVDALPASFRPPAP